MSSGSSIIQDALAEIGVSSVVTPASAQSIESGRKKLNSMLELWCSRGIDIGTTPLDAAGDELNEPADTRNTIVTNLALELAPLFANGKQVVTQSLTNNAREGFAMIKSLYGVLTIPKKVVSSTLPVGAGNKIGFAQRRTFFPEKSTLDN